MALAALLLWWRFSRELSQFDWLQWIFSMLMVGSLLAAVVYFAVLRLEPPIPEVFSFRHSQLFTTQRKQKMNQKVGQFRVFLSDLGFQFSTKKIPIGVGQQGYGFAKADLVGAHHITLRAERIDDLMAVTRAYSEYTFGRMFFNPVFPQPPIEHLGRGLMSDAFATYFNFSFWGRQAYQPHGWLAVFWEIRVRFGKKFTDELLAAAALSFLERPTAFGDYDLSGGGAVAVDIKDAAITKVICAHLLTGDTEVDNSRERWPTIVAIMKAHGFPVSE